MGATHLFFVVVNSGERLVMNYDSLTMEEKQFEFQDYLAHLYHLEKGYDENWVLHPCSSWENYMLPWYHEFLERYPDAKPQG